MEKLIIEKSREGRKGYTLPKLEIESTPISSLGENNLRQIDMKLPEVSENEVARHYTRLSLLNYNIDKGLYPLGSCTMKYNPKVNEKTASLPGFAGAHPALDDSMAQGAIRLMYELSRSLATIVGMDACTLQPCAGAQGELTGILLIRAYHKSRKDSKRTKILIPDSAHGTNPASAAFGGFDIVNIKSLPDGRVDIEDLRSKCGDDVAAFMLTNPNTVGLFEKNILEISKIIHGCGGLMYMDGANLNALIGIVRPADVGFDVMHINLHKTFSTPHGGGGPGAGPVACKKFLEPFLPIPIPTKEGDLYKLDWNRPETIGKIHSFFGNFGVLVRAYTYILMLGAKGIREVSESAIINANYLLSRIKDYFDVPYNGGSMHEFIISGDRQKKAGSSTKDIAKRLLDYGFHAPTIYFPVIVHEAMLIEPTETETREELDAFADAMIAIAKEIEEKPEFVNNAPYDTPMKRLDDALAARSLNIAWK